MDDLLKPISSIFAFQRYSLGFWNLRASPWATFLGSGALERDFEASLPRDLSYRLLPKQEGPVPALLQNRPLGSQLEQEA